MVKEGMFSRKLLRDQHLSDRINASLPLLPVCALSAVEEIHILLLLWRRGAHVAALSHCLRVHDAGRLAEAGYARAMPEADLLCSSGRCCCER